MKKVLALVLTLCLLVMSVSALAEGVFMRVTASSQGKTELDLSLKALTDEDGCYQFTLDGFSGEDAVKAFFQIGKEALVLGDGNQLVRIDYDKLLSAAQTALDKTLTAEEKTVLSVIYYLFTDFEDDMQIVQGLLSTEAMRLVSVMMMQGMISYSGDVILFEADQDQLVEAFKAYIAAVANDASVFATLSTTKAWQLLGLSADGSAEQEMLKQYAASIADFKLDGSFALRIRAEIGTQNGSLDLDVDFATADGKYDLAFEADYEDGKLDLGLEGELDGAQIEAELEYENNKLDYGLEITAPESKLDYDGELTFVGGVLTVEEELNVNVNNAYSPMNMAMDADARIDFANCEIAAKMNVDVDQNGTKNYLNASLSFDKLNGLDAAVETNLIDGSPAGAYLKANVQTSEYATVINCVLDLMKDGQTIDGYFQLDITVTDVIDLKSRLMGVYDLSAVFDIQTWEFNAQLTTPELNITADGVIENDIYTATVKENGQTVATAVLELAPGRPAIYNLLLGKLTITTSDGTTIVREAFLTENELKWVITVTANGQTNVVTLGIRFWEQDGLTHYEFYLANGLMEYDAGIAYTTDFGYADSVYAEVYLNMVSGTNVINMFKGTFEGEVLSETAQHVDAEPIPEEALESILENLIRQILGEARQIERRYF
ncbi:MAG: hypothetical protein II875_12150 [Clostridia bacterium]|nr:hypothetical protein [Clostridia bacterium]